MKMVTHVFQGSEAAQINHISFEIASVIFSYRGKIFNNSLYYNVLGYFQRAILLVHYSQL